LWLSLFASPVMAKAGADLADGQPWGFKRIVGLPSVHTRQTVGMLGVVAHARDADQASGGKRCKFVRHGVSSLLSGYW
jgi:hypothetical protein